MDDDPPPLLPIRGAPEGAGNPPFPTGPEPTDCPAPKPKRSRSRALVVTASQQAHQVRTFLSVNEIAAALREHRARMDYGSKVSLEAAIGAGKLLKLMQDEYGYRGERYHEFAKAYLGFGPRDSERLYLLGEKGDEVLARCEAETAIKSNFEWPSWRDVHKELLSEKNKRGRRLDDEPEPEPEPEPDPEPEPESPLAAMTRERDNLDAQVKAITQQYRDMRARKEEVEEERDRLVGEIENLRGLPLPEGATCRCFFCEKVDLGDNVFAMFVGRSGATICDSCIADAWAIEAERNPHGRAAIIEIETCREEEPDEPDEPEDGAG